MKRLVDLVYALWTAAVISLIAFFAIVGTMAATTYGLDGVIGAWLASLCNPDLPNTCNETGLLSGLLGLVISIPVGVCMLLTYLWPFELPSVVEWAKRLLDRLEAWGRS